MAVSPFDFVNSIFEDKTAEEFDAKVYSAYLTNKALSHHPDTLPLAVEVNQYRELDPFLHYMFLFNSVRKYKRRRMPWHKPGKNAVIELISEYYNCSLKKAEQMARSVTEEQINKMQAALEKGGATK